ncbi:mitotic spindle assembly checkpoint protein MAD2B [Halyomorpha halys]|uniref:mitotic spindle assembly checkpoint protein MAD2B n=1 Tax=Halyomorpha halys TaxID=286706 RepID=UPI0006D4FDFA
MIEQTLDIPAVVVEFLEVAVHVLLHSRKLYPDGIFRLKKKYGVPVHVSVHPELNKYITNSLAAIKHLLIAEDLKQVDICFFNDKGLLAERFVFYLKNISPFSTDSQVSFLPHLKESFRAFCLKLSVNSNFMKSLPKGSTFKIFIHTSEASSLAMNEDSAFQQFPWIEAEKRDVTIENPKIFPVRNIETDIMNIHIYSEENNASNSDVTMPFEISSDS